MEFDYILLEDSNPAGVFSRPWKLLTGLGSFALSFLAVKHALTPPQVLLSAEEAGEPNAADVPFRPKQAIAGVTVMPGPPTIGLGAAMTILGPSCLFSYQPKGHDPNPKFLAGKERQEVGWVYGAKLKDAGLAMPTGKAEDTLKGELICWPASQFKDKLKAADKFQNYSPLQGVLRRGTLKVCVADGSVQEAYWYYKAPPLKQAEVEVQLPPKGKKNKNAAVKVQQAAFARPGDASFKGGQGGGGDGGKPQGIRVWLERNRAGKPATVIKGFPGTEEELKELGKKLKNKCASGGSAKDGEIIIQGDHRDKVMEMLKAEGYKDVKKAAELPTLALHFSSSRRRTWRLQQHSFRHSSRVVDTAHIDSARNRTCIAWAPISSQRMLEALSRGNTLRYTWLDGLHRYVPIPRPFASIT
eukprot:g76646.t1